MGIIFAVHCPKETSQISANKDHAGQTKVSSDRCFSFSLTFAVKSLKVVSEKTYFATLLFNGEILHAETI